MSTNTNATSWFITPTETVGEPPARTRQPKYFESLSIGEWSGNILPTPSDVPIGTAEMYVVRAFAEASTLDTLGAKSDVLSLRDGEVTAGEVAEYLNGFFDENKTLDGWNDSFNTGSMPE